MAATYWYILFLPALALASIEIHLTGDLDSQKPIRFNGPVHQKRAKFKNPVLAVNMMGRMVNVISDTEMIFFKLNDESLKAAVGAYFGENPTDAYLRDPTPWKLYDNFKWRRVSRNLYPRKAKILNFTQTVTEEMSEENSTEPVRCNNSVSSSWTKGDGLTLLEEIQYKIDITDPSGGSNFSFCFTLPWGESAETFKSVIITDEALERNDTEKVKVKRNLIQMEIEFEARLFGVVAVNYGKVYKGHHFWGLDVNAVMGAGKLNTRFISKEVLEIVFYSSYNAEDDQESKPRGPKKGRTHK